MNKDRIILTLTLTLFAAGVAWAQGDEGQSPVPPPAPAFGQENPTLPVSENPPISAIDQPGLEPHAAPESFFLPGLHFSESLDSNVADTLGGSSTSTITRGLGSLTLQKLWKNYDVALDYIGGAAYYARKGVGLEQLQQFDIDNRINWKRGQLAIRDSFSYLPEGTFGFGAYGGSGAYNSGLGSLGAGMLGASAFGGQNNNAFNGGSGISLGQVPRLTNLGLADVIENLTPRSSLTLAAGYGLVHFYGDLTPLTGASSISFIGSREETAQVAYDRILNPKDQVAISYGYQGFDFSTTGTTFHANVVQLIYGHRISGRMNLLIAAGPQFTHIDSSATVCTILGHPLNVPASQCTAFGGSFVTENQPASHIGVAGRVLLRYRFPKTTVALSYQRYTTDGNGIFAGTQSNIGRLDAQRPLNRIWDAFADLGYSKNSRLQLAGSTVDANKFSYGYAGVGLHRQFSRSLRGFVSYQFNYSTFDTSCPVPGTAAGSVGCSNNSQRHVGSIGLDWTPRPIRID